MTSKQRSLRGAKTSFQDADEEEEYAVIVPAKPKVVKPLAKPSLLSFGGDEDTSTISRKTEIKKDKPKSSKFLRAPLELTVTDPLQTVASRSGNGEWHLCTQQSKGQYMRCFSYPLVLLESAH